VYGSLRRSKAQSAGRPDHAAFRQKHIQRTKKIPPERAGRIFLVEPLQPVSGNPQQCWVCRSAASLARRHHRHERLGFLPQCA
jgi:hypothetical protein